MRLLIVLFVVLVLSGCTSSISIGDENGVGIRSTLVKDGRIVAVETTDGNGRLNGN